MLETSFWALYPLIQTWGCFWSRLNCDQISAYFGSGITLQQSTKITVLQLLFIVLYSNRNMLPNQFLGKNFQYEVTMVILNQIFHYTHYTTSKHVMSLRGPSQHHCAWATQLLKEVNNDGKLLATLRSI